MQYPLNLKENELNRDKREDISTRPPVPHTVSVLEVIVPQASEAIAGIFSTVTSVPRIIVGVSSVLPPVESPFSSEDIQQSDKRKMVADEEGETAMPRRGTKGDGDARDS
ncbi:hypothetical protein Fot_19802 [Forsythia ovata]|uniref:Uncharacterized protein n=1 Tax=Forsythia ovata TaxID=205694 RepID=A0ABD1VM46_9LAMI